MRKRVCLDCPRIIPADAYKGRCPDCARAHDKARGTRQERGYDRDHDRTRRTLVARLRAGQVLTCWRCGSPITDERAMHVGHDDRDRSITRGAECAPCNLSAAGRNSHMS